jgi:hypothetical protein
MNTAQAKAAIDAALNQNISGTSAGLAALLPVGLLAGKLYEAKVLALLAKRLRWREKITMRLVNGNNLQLSSSPGPVRRHRPYIELLRGGTVEAELWADTEFLTLSHSRGGCPPIQNRSGYFHELDLLIIDARVGDGDYPRHDQLWLGVECKHTAFHKRYLREVLGVRRELSWFQPGMFRSKLPRLFPRGIPANPASALLFCCRQHRLRDYAAPARFFGVNFLHCTLSSPSLPRF